MWIVQYILNRLRYISTICVCRDDVWTLACTGCYQLIHYLDTADRLCTVRSRLLAPGLTLYINLDILLHSPLAVMASTGVVPFIPKLHVGYRQLRVEVVNGVPASGQGPPTAQPAYRWCGPDKEAQNSRYTLQYTACYISPCWFAAQTGLWEARPAFVFNNNLCQFITCTMLVSSTQCCLVLN